MSLHHHHDKPMMWIMLVACALPALAFLMAGTSQGLKAVLAPLGLVLMVVLHLVIVRRGDHAQRQKESSSEGAPDNPPTKFQS